ncbi:unnamed protein product [Prorocentrum cordatum]|uniref:Uncharacterized protein n=1 Tax=Prorocentrum cordatum TaxID=2364126 RepID=A0ABN9VUL6_9DINO|nr:unnamed protein product [Polarella glacialis]
MRVTVSLCSGREVGTLDAQPWWCLRHVLEATSEPGLASGSWRVFLGAVELRGDATLAQIGAQDGNSLTLVVTRELRVAVAHADLVEIYSGGPSEYQCSCKLEAHDGAVQSATFSPDGGLVLTLLRTLEGHGDSVVSATFSPDGRWALTASLDRTAKLWSVASGDRPISAAKVSMQESAISDGCGCWVCSSTSCRSLSFEKRLLALPALAMSSLAMSHSATAIGLAVLIRQLVVVQTLRRPWLHRLLPVAVEDGLRVLTASVDQTARIWSWSGESWECACTLRGHQDEVRSAVFSVDGQMALTASSDSTAKMWSVSSGRCERTLQGHQRELREASFSPNEQQVLTCSTDWTAKIWSASSGECLSTIGDHRYQVSCAVFAPDGSQVLTGSTGGVLRLWAPSGGRFLRTWKGHKCYVASAAFSPDGQEILTVDWGSSAKVWSAESRRCLITIQCMAGSLARFSQ